MSQVKPFSPLELDYRISQTKILVDEVSRKKAIETFIGVFIQLIQLPSFSMDHLKAFVKYLGYTDIMFYSLLSISKLIEGWAQEWPINDSPSEETRHIYLRNALSILLQLRIPQEDTKVRFFFKRDSKSSQTYERPVAQYSEAFTRAWKSMVQIKLPKDVHHQVLLSLETVVFPYVNSPLLFIDFLTRSMGQGDITALLALGGMSYLMLNNGAECPSFYTVLYSLIASPLCLCTPHTPLLLTQLDRFLSSPYLPQAVAASFVKRLL